MDTTSTSICVRCGKPRIVLSVNEEKIGTSVVVTTETICPDPECQKKVDGMLSVEQEKRHTSFLQKQSRLNARKPAKVALAK